MVPRASVVGWCVKEIDELKTALWIIQEQLPCFGDQILRESINARLPSSSSSVCCYSFSLVF